MLLLVIAKPRHEILKPFGFVDRHVGNKRDLPCLFRCIRAGGGGRIRRLGSGGRRIRLLAAAACQQGGGEGQRQCEGCPFQIRFHCSFSFMIY